MPLSRNVDQDDFDYWSHRACASDSALPSQPTLLDGQANLNNDNGVIRNVPLNVLTDQFGMLGLGSAQQTLRKFPTVASITKGIKTEELQANMSPSVSFPGPLGHGGALGPNELSPPTRVPEYDLSSRIHDASEHVGNMKIVSREKVKPVDVTKYPEDQLFYMFYTFVGDSLQMIAAGELYRRNWRYDMANRFWFTRPIAQQSDYVITAEWEKGDYILFDPFVFKSVRKRLTILHSDIEGQPPHINPDCLKF